MSQRMLIDARHPEETRVAVVNGQRIDEFDFEAADRKQLKGNIYLAKVTRVEPSLQAAFVEYGGNRHGFLAFSEIHPDYYQIPREDREALLREEALDAEHDDHDDHHDDDHTEHAEHEADDNRANGHGHDHGHMGEPGEAGDEVAVTGGQHDEPTDALRRRRQALRRRYKIQEVIRRRQVLLIQVVKEERGNKGAALTTYLSLAGRYCVLMPNTAHGGGISRKIANPADRKRLKAIMADLKLPTGMGAIVRTAGLKRGHADIRRDFDYLTRLWDEIRDKTLTSVAPCLVHQDSDLVKRAIRDIYNRDIEQILVEGRDGFEAAERFMSLLMPTHAPKVVEYDDSVPLFQRFGVEGQLAAMYQPVVQLKSGGYLVINPTEALVSIDINSGRSTREHGIEETATKTNLEAADEIARQLRLRDMAGLVVIDFIDMEHSGNIRKVERAMKEAMKNDRARIQIGRISSFGLMEMSRQRLRTGMLEASTHICPMCDGTGTVRSVASAALAALRGLEAEALRGRASEFMLRAGEEVAVYILNRKRLELADLEERYGVTITTVPDEGLIGPNFAIDAAGTAPTKRVEMRPIAMPVRIIDEDDVPQIEEDEAAGDDETGEERVAREARNEARSDGRRGRGRRRRGGRGRDEAPGTSVDGEAVSDSGDAAAAATETAETADTVDTAPAERGDRRRRRGRRGGKRKVGGEAGEIDATADDANQTVSVEPAADGVAGDVVAKPRRAPRRRKEGGSGATPETATAGIGTAETETQTAPVATSDVDAAAPDSGTDTPVEAKRPSRRRKAGAATDAGAIAAPAVKAVVETPPPALPVVATEAPAKPPRRSRAKAAVPVADSDAPVEAAAATASLPPVTTGKAPPPGSDVTPPANDANGSNDAAAPKKGGWWQRTFG